MHAVDEEHHSEPHRWTTDTPAPCNLLINEELCGRQKVGIRRLIRAPGRGDESVGPPSHTPGV